MSEPKGGGPGRKKIRLGDLLVAPEAREGVDERLLELAEPFALLA